MCKESKSLKKKEKEKKNNLQVSGSYWVTTAPKVSSKQWQRHPQKKGKWPPNQLWEETDQQDGYFFPQWHLEKRQQMVFKEMLQILFLFLPIPVSQVTPEHC